MKLLDIIIKEISVIKSQKIALLLILLYPFLAISLLGMSLSGLNLNVMGAINIGIVNELEFDSSILQDLASKQANISIKEYNELNDLKFGIKKKDIVVGLILKGQDEASQIIVDLYYDNSNIIGNSMFKEFVKIIMQSFATDKTKEILSEVWGVFSNLKSNLNEELNTIENFKLKLVEAESSLNILEGKLNLIDFNEIESTLSGQQSQINSFEQKNNTFKTELINFKLAFEDLKKETNNFGERLDNYSNQLNLIDSQISQRKTSIENQIILLEQQKANSPNDLKPLYQSQIDFLTPLKNELTSWNNDTTTAKNLIQDIVNDQEKLENSFSEADKIFSTLNTESESVSNALNSSSSTLNEMNEKLIVFKESVEEVRTMILGARESKAEIEEKLNSSSTLMTSFTSKLADMQEIDTSVVAQPIKIFEKRVYSPKQLPFALMPIDPLLIGSVVSNAVSLVLILTCLLLTSIIVILERKENVALRLQLSPTNKFVLIFGKILGQLMIAITEATIIYLIALFVFGIDFIPNLPQVYIGTILIAISFISLGLIISSFTKTQSTAILLSLLAIIPMLFLSGIIIPTSLMTEPMQIFSSLLPLSAANNLLIGLIIKGLSLFDLIVEVMVLLFVIIVGLLITLLKKGY